MISNRELRKSTDDDDDDESIKDVQVRKDIQILSARLYDIREKFMKIIHKINNDSIDFYLIDSLFFVFFYSEDDTTSKKSNGEISFDKDDSDSTETSNQDSHDNNNDDESQTQKCKVHLEIRKLSIESILERKARHHEYIKYVVQYPKIMKYLMNDDPNCINIPLRYLEPFIKEHVNEKPNGGIYDKVNHQIQDIRRKYLKHCQ
ncbi:unnamed protein product [Rotaria sordida]|uniref:Uncharacterized protein n=1 Tax=Rotaria sordida TaxID=392033 RepID=A0A813VH83_9BILA|nr:unnamed protein product [Rotaria sordida]